MRGRDLSRAWNTLLQPERFDDPGINGLQVEGDRDIRRLLFGVSACEELFTFASTNDFDGIVVHHGLFWKDGPFLPVGMMGKRLRILLEGSLSLWAYHLPLDAHREVGNNYPALRDWGAEEVAPFGDWKGASIGACGAFLTEREPLPFGQMLSDYFNHPTIHLEGEGMVKRVGIVSGGGASFIQEAYQMGLDALITGEAEERSIYEARELGIHIYAMGHHATERMGVRLLGDWTTKNHAIECTFWDAPNPV
ncbi:Nif3-like dinuclear metal center hexameric protein [bacterium]|nr:Nif3-like dinuclear metal center hexameric protein [bacterium]